MALNLAGALQYYMIKAKCYIFLRLKEQKLLLSDFFTKDVNIMGYRIDLYIGPASVDWTSLMA